MCLQINKNRDIFNIFQTAEGNMETMPIGNLNELRAYKLKDAAGMRVEGDGKMVLFAFPDGREIELPPDASMFQPTKDGKVSSVPSQSSA